MLNSRRNRKMAHLRGYREHRVVLWIAAGIIALGAHGFVATFQPDPDRVEAANGGIFVAGSLAWGMIFDGFRPDHFAVIGAAICLIGVSVIMFAPRTYTTAHNRDDGRVWSMRVPRCSAVVV